MAKIIAPAIRIRVEPNVKPRPLPKSIVDVFALSERDFKRMAAELESDERFNRLVRMGLLEKVRLRGKIPRYKYEEYMDGELVSFINEYGVTGHYDWQKDFFEEGALSRKRALAKKYGAPVGRLARILRYCCYLRELEAGTGPSVRLDLDAASPDFLEFTASESEILDTAPIIEKIRRFVDVYNLDLPRFKRLFFRHGADEEELVGFTGASYPEVREMIELVRRIQVVNSFQVEVRRAAPKPSPKRKIRPVAEFYLESNGIDVSLRLLGDDIYDVKYRFPRNTTDDIAGLSSSDNRFLERCKAVNQRKNLLCRIVMMLFRYQYNFLSSGDPLDLYPLKQKQAAAMLFEEEAAVSRLIRDKFVRLPDGKLVPLRYLFRKVGDIVGDLILIREKNEMDMGLRSRPFTDIELREILCTDYGVRLSRRSITYHRNKVLNDGNYYSRRRRGLKNKE